MEEIIDKMIQAKIEHKEYKELAEEYEDIELKNLFENVAEKEKESYHLMKDYLMAHIN